MPTSVPRHNAGQAARQYERTRPNANQRGYTALWHRNLRPIVLKRDKYLCVKCREPVGHSGHVDHIIEKDKGGADSLENLQTLCARCHTIKTRREHARP